MRVFTQLLFLAITLLVSVVASAAINPWTATGSLATARSGHTATLLLSGKLLVTGGITGTTVLESAELFDPATNTWSAAAGLTTTRSFHTATLLRSGKVLVVGGATSTALASAEVYDPATNTWSAAGSLKYARYSHTATLLASGKVLVVGGFGRDLSVSGAEHYLATAEIYDPGTNTWSPAASLANVRYEHTATLLASGKVLIAAGFGNGSYLGAAEVYDPSTNTWASAGNTFGRRSHTATLLSTGKVLVFGGNSDGNAIAYPELYDPGTNSWSLGGTGPGTLPIARMNHTATLLPSGLVLIAGGAAGSYLDDAVLYDPAANSWVSAGHLVAARSAHSATLLPTGEVLIVGGDNGSSLASTELYSPAAATSSAVGAMKVPRYYFPATLLPSGKVLAGSSDGSSGDVAKTDLYDPAAKTWSAAAPMLIGRSAHTQTLLPSGRVFTAGGFANSGPTTDAELYDPVTNSWATAAALPTPARGYPAATLLASGKVLLSGGLTASTSSTVTANVDLYDPATDSWNSQGSLAAARYLHTATLLPTGKVLVVGGLETHGAALASAELYIPATHAWSAAAAPVARAAHTATLLPSGKVLVAGGTGSDLLNSAQLYDPATDSWSAAGSLATTRFRHTATLLPSGKVLVAGGLTNNGSLTTLTSTEIYDPATNAWTPGADLVSARSYHAATLLASGSVLVMGGIYIAGGSTVLNDSEVYDPGLAPNTLRQPNLSATNAFLLQTNPLAATGSGFAPSLQASGGASNDSATNVPVLQVQRLDNDEMRFVANDETVNFTDTSFTGSTSAFAGFPAGPVLVRAWVNGVPSAARYSTFAVPPSAPAAPIAIGGVAKATVNFTPTTDDGGAPILSYIVVASPGGASYSCLATCTSAVFNPMPAGTYTFTVQAVNAAGNGFAPGYSPSSPPSNSVTVTQLTQATPTLAVTSSAIPSPVGATVTFIATLSGASNSSGNVSICIDASTTDATCSGGVALCTISASLEPIACSTSALSAGAHAVSAYFAGDANNAAAISPVLTQLIGTAPAITSANSATFTIGTPGSFTITATGTPVPSIDASSISSPDGIHFVNNANGTATLSGTPTLGSVGTYSVFLKASNGITPDALQTFTLIVKRADQLLTFPAQSPASHAFVANGPFTIAPFATSVTPNSGNPVVYSSLTTSVCLVSGTTVTMISVGTCTIAADQAGDNNFNAALQVTQNVAIGQSTSSVVITSSGNPSNVGQAVTFTATVVPGASTTGADIHGSTGGMAVIFQRVHVQGAIQAFPAGTMSFADGATSLGSVLLNNGSASLTTTFAVPGNHTITATYSGDANTAATSIMLVQVVNAAALVEAVAAPMLSTWMLVLLGALLGTTALARARRARDI